MSKLLVGRVCVWFCGLWFAGVAVAAWGATPVEARRLWLTGKYAEALEAWDSVAQADPLAAALGRARCQASTGERDAALATLSAAQPKHPQSAELPAELARLHFLSGHDAQTDAAVAAALKLDPDQLLARWVQAERHRVLGRLDQAEAAYAWFVAYYNDHDLKRPEDLHLIGLAAAQYARWKRLPEQFTFLVNDLYPEIVELDPDYWPAQHESGRLYLEKYNEPEARKSLQAALGINAQAADVYASVAELALQNYQLDEARRAANRALEIDRLNLAARIALADAHLANFETTEALAELTRARETHPIDERLLGRWAGVTAVIDGLSSQAESAPDDARLAVVTREVESRNPRCGEFYHGLAGALELARRYPLAARYWRLAVERMPQLAAPQSELGLVLMRLGRETEARRVLDEAFAADPFHVRVSNSRKVLDVLADYAVIETEHFVLRYDRGRDALLARQAARYLEAHVYPTLTAHFQFQPAEKSLFEIFNRSRNTSGHGWFSARMVGLPYVGTVGACAGQMVALASPGDMPKPYNWSRVLKHEFVHVLNLQQTDFRIPHWFTEALAVESEGYARPQEWNQMLRRRVPAGEMFNLDTINLAFVRPRQAEDWQMAYCQAQLYAQFMVATYGPDALAKMLAAYARNDDTRQALKRSFDVEQAAFEKEYRLYVQKLVDELGQRASSAARLDPLQVTRAYEANPQDPDAAAGMARLALDKEDYATARRLADGVRQKHPRHPLAAYVLARVRLVVGEEDEARKLLSAALDRQQPDFDVLELLASLEVDQEAWDAATELYELAARRAPDDLRWVRHLARVFLKSNNVAKLKPVLRTLAEADADDRLVRKKLAQLAAAEDDHAEALRWAQDVVYINAEDADAYRMIGAAARQLAQPARAIEAYESLVLLDGDDLESRLALAESFLADKRPEAARRALDALLEKSPDHAAALRLRKSLDEGK